MATVINNPPQTTGRRADGSGFLLGIIILILILVLFFYYGLPAIRGAGQTNVTVPDQIDVNVNTPQDGGTTVPETTQ